MNDASFDPLAGLRALVDHGVRFVLTGGSAAALAPLGARLRGVPRGVRFRLDGRTLEAGDHSTLATEVGAIDCLGTPAGTEGFADLDASATDEDLDGLVVCVASLDDLIRMKRAAGRRQDRIAVEWLSALRDELDT